MNVAVVCALGLGDGLLMQIAARHLRDLGHRVTTFSDPLLALREWFPGFSFLPRRAPREGFDAVVLEYDNSERARQVAQQNVPVYTLYPSHNTAKHGPLREGRDFVFTRKKCVAHNIADAMQALFPGVARSLGNGIVAPHHLVHRKFPRRIALHPTSSMPEKNWPRGRFFKLRDALAARGFEPVFVTAPEEAALWDAPLLPTLADLAAFLYESGGFVGNDSGPGHLASCLGLPTVTVGPNLDDNLTLWRPGWSPGAVCTAPAWAMHFKALRPYWGTLVSVRQVLNQFFTTHNQKVSYERPCSTSQ